MKVINEMMFDTMSVFGKQKHVDVKLDSVKSDNRSRLHKRNIYENSDTIVSLPSYCRKNFVNFKSRQICRSRNSTG